MKSTQSLLLCLIFTLFFLMSLTSWAQFNIITTGASPSSHTDITCNNSSEGNTNDGSITLNFTNTSGETLTGVVWKNSGSAWSIAYDDNTGGTYPDPPYSNNTPTQKAYNNLSTGSYFIVVTGVTSGEVETSTTFVITKPNALSLVINDNASYSPLCFGETNGRISATAYGGAGDYAYGISAVANTGHDYTFDSDDADGLFDVGIGTYYLSVQATDGSKVCTYDFATTERKKILTGPIALTLGTPTATDVACFRETNGSIKIPTATSTGSGGLIYGLAISNTGTTPSNTAFSFTQTGEGTGAEFQTLSASATGQSYYVAVQDANGCVAQSATPVRVEEPSADITVGGFMRDNPSGNGLSDGSVQLSGGGISGGTAPYRYNWIDAAGVSVGTLANLPSRRQGIYTLTVLDTAGCAKTFAQQTLVDCFDVAETIVNLSGFELGNGSIALLPVTDNTTATYTWDVTWSGLASGSVTPDAAPNTRNLEVTTPTTAAAASPNTNVLVVDTANIDVGDIITGSGVVGVVTVIEKPLSGTNVGRLLISSNHNIPIGTNLTFTPLKILSLGADTYTATITGTDNSGNVCIKTKPYPITQPAEFSLTLLTSPRTISEDANDIICKDANDAYITATTSGGTSPFQIQYRYKENLGDSYSAVYGVFTTPIGAWNNQFTNGLTSSNLPAGHYSVRLKDYNGIFSNEKEIIIKEPTSGFTMPIIAATAWVNGGISAATTTLVVDNNKGAIKPLDIITGKKIDGTLFTRTVILVSADQRTLVVDANILLLKDNTVLTFTNDNTLEVTDVSCYGLDNGVAQFKEIDGHEIPSTGINWYKWSGSTKNKLDPLIGKTLVESLLEGSYSLELLDAFGCLKSSNFSVNEPEILSLDNTPGPISCAESSTAFVDGDYTGAAVNSIIKIKGSLGTISVGNAATGNAITEIITVISINPDQTEVTLSQDIDPGDGDTLTFVPTGSASILVGGGNPNSLNNQYYTYTWFEGGDVVPDDAIDNTLDKSRTKLTVTAGAAGATDEYTLIVTDFNGCTYTPETPEYTDKYEIKVPTVISISLEDVAGKYAYGKDSTAKSGPTCLGGSDGYILLNVQGGSPNDLYGYRYSWFKDGASTVIASSQDVTGLDNGKYDVIVTDGNGCTRNSQDYDIKSPTTRYTIEDLPTVAVTASASISSTNLSLVSNANIEVNDVISGDEITGVVTVVALVGTTDLTLSSNQTVLSGVPLSFTPSDASLLTNSTCFGESSGQIEVSVTAPLDHLADYRYAWFLGRTATGPVLEDEKIIDSLSANYYTFQVIDYYGCVAEATYDITEYSAMQVSSIVENNLCAGDQSASIEIEANGGNSYKYYYKWAKNGVEFNPGDTLSWTDTELTSLTSGIYKVIVTDTEGCDKEKSFEINEIPLISVAKTSTDNVCKNGDAGKIDVNISGGNAPYTTTWTKSGVFVDDTQNLNNLTAGTYRLTVVDELNCPAKEEDFTITEPPTAYYINPLGTDPNCFEAQDGEIDIVITEDSTHPTLYEIKWFKDRLSYKTTNTGILSALNGGFYKFTITDSNRCEKTDSLTLNEPSDIYLHPVIDTLECYNAENAVITLDPTGGTGLYPTIVWQYKDLPTSNIAFEASYLGPGDHSIRLTDSKNCIKDSTIVIANPANMAVDTTIVNVKCKDASTGTISVAMINGKPNYSYAWVADGIVFSTSNAIDSLASGDYFLAVQDDYLCLSDTFTINVTEPNNHYNINGDITRISCKDSTDANILISIDVLGESTDFTYAWEENGAPISESRDQIDINSGTYTIGVTDNFGCLRTNTFTVDNPDPIIITSTQENILCYGDSTGLIAISPVGGWGNFTYEWKRNLVPLPITESFGNTLPAGDYIIDVIDDGLCVTPVPITLTTADTIVFNAVSSNVNCYKQRNGAISVSVTGGVPEYTYDWAKDGNPYSQRINLNKLGKGNYELIITDGALCEYSSGIIEITEPDILSLDLLSFQNNLCTTTSNGAFSIAATGGTGDYTYRLNDGDPFPISNFDGLTGGIQNIEITDENLCVFDTVLVVETDYLLVSAFDWDYEYPYIDWPVSFFDASLGPDIVNWAWDLGNGALTNDVNSGFTYISPGSYPITLKITNTVGCEAVTTEILNIEKGFRVTVPTAFTPNLDGLNDYFRPTLENIISLSLIVYNKYGSVVFETRDLDGEWDGNLDLVPLPQDSYLYEITYVAESGVSRTSRGKVAMLR